MNIEQFFWDLFHAIEGYYSECSFWDSVFWIYPFSALLASYFLTIIFSKRINPDRPAYKRTFFIHIFWIASSCIVSMIFIAMLCYNWSTGYYTQEPVRLSHLIALIISMSIPIVSFLSLRRFYRKQTLKEIIGPATSREEQNNLWKNAKKSFNKAKIWLALPLLGFTLLFFVLTRDYALISIVIDNSGSMWQNTVGLVPPIDIGKEALTKIIDDLNNNTDIIVTTLKGEGNIGGDFPTLDSINDLTKLDAESHIFTDRNDVAIFIQNIEVNLGSPICEAMIDNFRFTMVNKNNRDYKTFVLIVLTDGADGGITNFNHFFCDYQNYNNLFQVENIHFINIGMTTNRFYDAVHRCAYDEREGIDSESYNLALRDVLKAYRGDQSFIIFIILIFVVFTLIPLSIQPKKMEMV